MRRSAYFVGVLLVTGAAAPMANWSRDADWNAGPDVSGSVAQAAPSDFIYLPAIIGSDPDSGQVGIEVQTRLVLERLRDTLRTQGMALTDVVSTNVYLSDARDFDTMNGVYRGFFATNPPPRATVQSDLPTPGARVMLSVVAARPHVTRNVIVPQDLASPELPYSWAVLARNTLFVAGLTSRDPKTYGPIIGDVATQTRRAMDNLGVILREAGMDYADVSSCTVYLEDARTFREMNEVYGSFFPSAPPARATVRARLMNPGFAVEIQCVAAQDGTRRALSASGSGPSRVPLSPAIQVGNRVFLSGMVGSGPDGFAKGDVAAQTWQTLENLRVTLAAAQMSFDNVINSTVYVTDVRHAEVVAQVFAEAVTAYRGVSTTVGASLMSPDALVEIAMVAELRR